MNVIQKMNATGIGYAGVDGVWWQPAQSPYRFDPAVQQALNGIGPALFAYLDALSRLYAEGCKPVREMLDYKVPSYLLPFSGPGLVDQLRPDFQLVPTGDGNHQLVLTEIECSPSAHGVAHAMQVGYSLAPDLAAAFANYLDGRMLIFAGTHQWSAFMFEQLAFCKALAELNATGRVLYDQTVTRIAAEVRIGYRWQPPFFGIVELPADWDNAIGARIQRHGQLTYLWPDDSAWPETVDDAVVFRFGYLENFYPEGLAAFQRWTARGATMLNPLQHYLDNKVLLALLTIPDLRQELSKAHRAILDRCIPETHLLTEEMAEQLFSEQKEWVLKYGGFDNGTGSWGGQSLMVGQFCDSPGWKIAITHLLQQPWPVIAQRYIHTAHLNVDYLDRNNQPQTLRDGRSRLRAFYLRHHSAACGVHLTVSDQGAVVSEGLQAVQAPVVFETRT